MKYLVTLNNVNYEVEVEESKVSLISSSPAAAPAPAQSPVSSATAATAAAKAPSADGQKVISPMPGTILSVKVSAGSSVKKGDVIMILEAMKMENDIVAPIDGTIKEIVVQKGSTVQTDDVLAVIG